MRRPTLLLSPLVLALACGGDDTAAGPDATSDVRTLATCTTSVAADAPAFYQRYFKCVTITRGAASVTITTEDLPPHPSYYYGDASPNFAAFDTSRGAAYHPNPNQLARQAISITIPDAPAFAGVPIIPDLIDATAGTSPAEYGLGPIGVAIDSVALFTGTAAPGDDIAAERFTFDGYEAHPEQRGTYHYHRPTPGPLEVLAAAGDVTTTVPGDAAVELYGILCDGTVVLGCTELDGAAPTSLDAQGGHLGELRAGDGTAYFTDRYHVHVCADPARGHAFTPEIHYYGACPR
ncbi:MAG: YHYH protein [Myxococcales bacterium]|nr:YHYH protein [Myxococcales bacterium]